MEYSHNIYLDTDSCQQPKNTAKDCLKQQPQQEKDDKAQGPFTTVALLALDTSRQEAPAVRRGVAMGSATRLDVTRGCNCNLSHLRKMM